MNLNLSLSVASTGAGCPAGPAPEEKASHHGQTSIRADCVVFVALLVAFNFPLLSGAPSTRFNFQADAVAAGEWWRLLTYPWVHVSAYHLALDALGFLVAYVELSGWSRIARLGVVAASVAGSLLAALAWSPLVWSHGLGGLSGVAHGLTAVVGLEMISQGKDGWGRGWGRACLFGVVAKSLIEAVTGQVLFQSWHLGSLGTPIAGCHLGGVLGAAGVWLWAHGGRGGWRPCRGACAVGDAGSLREFNPPGRAVPGPGRGG